MPTVATRPDRVSAASNAPRLSLLVVDDDREFCDSLKTLLKQEGLDVSGVASLAAARAALAANEYDAALVDLHLPDGDGLELLANCAERGSTELIVITGHATVSSAVGALKDGALDYLTKPLDRAKLESTLANLRRTNTLKREVRSLRRELLKHGRFGPIVARSASMQAILEQIARVAPTDASVLIEGESGTGKEVVAQAIHELSLRRDSPLIPVNCGAIPEALIESELFGHERGSFTGADKMHRGFFERADGGTLFLDEISEMPLRLQVRLLRVLETGRVQRIGSDDSIPTNVRVLAATNRDPQQAIRDGRLREDLYFRLAVFPIRLPSLRAREGDVALLAQHFLDLLNEAHGTAKRWDEGTLGELAARAWPGNVRELKNVVYRAYILADEILKAEATPVRASSQAVVNGSVVELRVGASIADVEQTLIVATLERVHGDKAAAATMLGISLKTLYNRLNVYKAAAT
jgi:DNA-binding NtrC family response regulator